MGERPLDVRAMVGTHDVLLVTLDTLRYDVAKEAEERGLTPRLTEQLGRWEERHSPASFTYAAHHAFFAGFLPTPARPGRHARPFAAAFAGSETTADTTFVFDAPDIVHGFADHGYHTLCIGGVGFFNLQNPLGRVLPAMFQERHWSPALGVTDPRSTENQVNLALERLAALAPERRVFLFVNVSALHQPNCIFVDGAELDDKTTMTAALGYVDRELPRLILAMRRRAPLLAIVTSDHGTAYGEDGYVGHRLAHPVVWTVPYAERAFPQWTPPSRGARA